MCDHCCWFVCCDCGCCVCFSCFVVSAAAIVAIGLGAGIAVVVLAVLFFRVFVITAMVGFGFSGLVLSISTL